MQHLSGRRFAELLRSPVAGDELGREPRAVVVDWSDAGDAALPNASAEVPAALATAPVVIVGIALGDKAQAVAAVWSDVLVPDLSAAAEVAAAVEAQPTAAAALVLLLRGAAGRTIVDGLVAESATYSALQAGAEHQQWLAIRPQVGRDTRRDRPVVELARAGDRLDIVLARPERRNAFSAQMRDELLAALAVAVADPSIVEVVLRGAGPVFCSGGDLDEFGTGGDPGANHLVRLATSAGATLADIAGRVTVEVQGSCVGAGVELPAFAGRVVAAPDTTFRLPELEMGLIPGAGGTVSLPRRIGRHRSVWLALTGQAIDVRTAQRWGLVDVVEG